MYCMYVVARSSFMSRMRQGCVVRIPFFKVLQFDILAKIRWNSVEIPVTSGGIPARFWQSVQNYRKPTKSHNSAFPQPRSSILYKDSSRHPLHGDPKKGIREKGYFFVIVFVLYHFISNFIYYCICYFVYRGIRKRGSGKKLTFNWRTDLSCRTAAAMLDQNKKKRKEITNTHNH